MKTASRTYTARSARASAARLSRQELPNGAVSRLPVVGPEPGLPVVVAGQVSRRRRSGAASVKIGPWAVALAVGLMAGVFALSWHYGQTDQAVRAEVGGLRQGQVSARSLSDLPTPATVGVPEGMVLKPSASLTVRTPAAVIEGLEVSGSITVAANDVTIRRVRVTGNEPVLIHVEQGMTGVVITDVEVVGGAAATEPITGVLGPALLRQVDIRGVSTAVVPSSGTQIERCLISNLRPFKGPDASGVEGIHIGDGQSHITVVNSVIDATVSDGVGDALVVENRYGGPVEATTVLSSKLKGGAAALRLDGTHQPQGLQIRVSDSQLESLQAPVVVAHAAQVNP